MFWLLSNVQGSPFKSVECKKFSKSSTEVILWEMLKKLFHEMAAINLISRFFFFFWGGISKIQHSKWDTLYNTTVLCTYRFPSWSLLVATEQGRIRLHIFEDTELHSQNYCHCLCNPHKRTIYIVAVIIIYKRISYYFYVKY